MTPASIKKGKCNIIMTIRRIQPVQNNEEKKVTYATYKSQLNKAIKYEFYLEAMMIEYGIMEDRMRSFIYHIGGLPNRMSTKIGSKRTKGYLKEIVSDYRTNKEKDNLGITNISGKEKIIRCVLRWSLDENKQIVNDKYLISLDRQINERVDATELLTLLDQIDEWCAFRNEVVHALLNKNITSINSQIAGEVETGKRLAEELSGFEAKIKYGNRIRRAANLKTD